VFVADKLGSLVVYSENYWRVNLLTYFTYLLYLHMR